MLHAIFLSLIPIFFVLGLGYYAGRTHRVDNQNIQSLNTLVMRFALPAALFVSTAHASRQVLFQQMDLFFILILSMLVIFVISFILERYAWKQDASIATVQACTVALPNYAAIGYLYYRSPFHRRKR